MRPDSSDLQDIPDDHLEFLERLAFKEFDEAYRRYYQDDLPVLDEVRAWEQALETITAIRSASEEERRKAIEQTAEDTIEVLDLRQ